MCHTVTRGNFSVYCLLAACIEIKGVSANSQIKHVLSTCFIVIIVTHLPLSAYSRTAILKTIFIHEKAYNFASQIRGLSNTHVLLINLNYASKKKKLKWNVLINSVVFNSVCCKFTIQLQLAIEFAFGVQQKRLNSLYSTNHFKVSWCTQKEKKKITVSYISSALKGLSLIFFFPVKKTNWDY